MYYGTRLPAETTVNKQDTIEYYKGFIMLRVKLDRDTFAALIRRGKTRGMQLVEVVDSMTAIVIVSGTDKEIVVSL